LPFVSKDVLYHKHACASAAKEFVGPIWDDARKIAIYRPDHEIAMSWYQHIQRFAQERTEEDRQFCAVGWWDKVTRLKGLTFEEFSEVEPAPTMDAYCDLPEVERLPFAEVAAYLNDLFGMNVDFSQIRSTSALPNGCSSI
jgi:hypothetical protein